jgi:DNA-binding response OmpR family regulator
MKMKKPKIALIEDDEVLSIVMQEELAKAGFDVSLAFDGEKGIKLVRSKKPDLVLLDLLLPKKSGFEVLQELKKAPQTKSIPVVILTVLSMDEGIQKALRAGADDYFVKSQHTALELVEMIKNFFAGGILSKDRPLSLK